MCNNCIICRIWLQPQHSYSTACSTQHCTRHSSKHSMASKHSCQSIARHCLRHSSLSTALSHTQHCLTHSMPEHSSLSTPCLNTACLHLTWSKSRMVHSSVLTCSQRFCAGRPSLQPQSQPHKILPEKHAPVQSKTGCRFRTCNLGMSDN